MKYQVINKTNDEVEFEFFNEEEAIETIEFDFSWDTHTINEIVGCKKCGNEAYERRDWYGISEGHWCDECYEPRPRYATIEFDGYGEKLNLDS